MNLFKKKKTYINIVRSQESELKELPKIPDGTWVKCTHCGKTIYQKELTEYKICPECGGHFRIGAMDRIAITCDENSFEEFNAGLTSLNPIDFPKYDEIIKNAQERSGLKEGVVTGKCRIEGIEIILCVMDSNFMMGSMGSVVGEKITRAFEKATEEKLPIIVFTTSGGARMQEGIISLMQMAKISAAVRRHSDKGLLYITVLTDPTTGGVTASFAMLGDIILSEPGATIGFAGKRVIEQTIRQELPEGFQTAEFQLKHGFVDKIVKRKYLKMVLAKLLRLHGYKEV
ncbi:acetyl-CoA carboxylase, carboxyltransferase subunit beta [Anaerotignum sp. MSJ-24]|nr:acetyl-CoA carboxylase, carboxyltransferase subunit beta [Anaerotignum sp. MSJ-24]MBU5463529.1 acetyl-CoA carboxylase, carboxyltransferase subunit beta [Anaerotignum sp. MSJ-24]